MNWNEMKKVKSRRIYILRELVVSDMWETSGSVRACLPHLIASITLSGYAWTFLSPSLTHSLTTQIYIYDKDLRKEKCFYDRYYALKVFEGHESGRRNQKHNNNEWVTHMNCQNLRTTQTMHDIKAWNNLNFMEIFPPPHKWASLEIRISTTFSSPWLFLFLLLLQTVNMGMWFNVVSFDEYIVSLTRIFDLKNFALKCSLYVLKNIFSSYNISYFFFFLVICKEWEGKSIWRPHE